MQNQAQLERAASGPGRPRRQVDAARIRRLRDQGWTLNEIARAVGCGRGTVARALERTAAPHSRPAAPVVPLRDRASELARGRNDPPANDAARRERLREDARHLVHRRWGDGMKVEGQPFRPPHDPPPASGREGPRWTGVLLIAGGLLLWAMGCPVPL